MKTVHSFKNTGG